MMADVNVLWNNCLKVIKDNVSEEAYKTWFDPIVPLKYENNEFVVEVPSMFFYEYIEEKFAELLRLTLSREVGESTRLMYRVVMDRTSQTTTDVPAAIVENTERPSQSVLNVMSSSRFKKFSPKQFNHHLIQICNCFLVLEFLLIHVHRW